MTKPKVTEQHHVLAVPDIRATASWWVEKMGPEIRIEPEGWIFLRCGPFSLMLGECPDAIAPADLGDHQYFAYVVMDDVAAYHEEIAGRGAEVSPPQGRPWGMREMPVQTPGGHPLFC